MITNTAVVLIESSPTNLDVRVGSDAQSERIGGVIFDGLVKKDDALLQPAAVAGDAVGAAGCFDVGVPPARWGALSAMAGRLEVAEDVAVVDPQHVMTARMATG